MHLLHNDELANQAHGEADWRSKVFPAHLSVAQATKVQSTIGWWTRRAGGRCSNIACTNGYMRAGAGAGETRPEPQPRLN